MTATATLQSERNRAATHKLAPMADEEILDRDVVARILRRATELEQRTLPSNSGFGEAALLAAADEVGLCVEAFDQLKSDGIKARIVSMPSWEIFEQQTPEYQESVLPSAVTARISVEQSSTFGWSRYTGLRGERVGMKTFGASAPLVELQKKFGFLPESVVAQAKQMLGK